MVGVRLTAAFQRLRLLCLRGQPASPASQSLRVLTAAALALPGLTHLPAHAAEGDDVGFQYGRFEEGERNLFGVNSKFDPIVVDSLHGSGSLTFFDRLKFTFNYLQDTWSGATPIATAPLDLRGNRPTAPDGISGATPVINGRLFFDSQFNVLNTDGFGNLTGGTSRQLVHTLSSASPETRKQGDFKLAYEWDEAALEVGGGLSLESDYESRWGSLNGRWDLNQKLTTLSWAFSYTASDIEALLDHDANPYIDKLAFLDQIERIEFGDRLLRGEREDWAVHLGLTQILSKNTLIETGFGFTRNAGYLENPYKAVEVAFIDPDQQFLPPGAPPGTSVGTVHALLEQRPDVRNQWTWDARYGQYVEGLDAALHLSYGYFHDDWGIDAHTFEAEWGQPVGQGWTITPRIRYYSQEAADFYRPFLISRQAYRPNDFDLNLLPDNFSSDHRLSGFGALSGGVTVEKQFAKGVSIEAGFEYYTHQGGLKLGGGGEADFADFDYWMANAALKVDLSSSFLVGEGGHSGHGHPVGNGHGAHQPPAGIMAHHMLHRAGDFMVGYRYMYSHQGGDMLHGSNVASDQSIINRGCDEKCRVTPHGMSMHMHMLELMYAPTDWLNLMLMPQFMDMEMDLRHFKNAPPPTDPDAFIAPPHLTRHSTGVIGDTPLYALFKLFDVPGHHLHMGLGLSAPTGDLDLKLRPRHQPPSDEFLHYGMQLGSGTWDLLPSLTYTSHFDRWSWGGQLSGILRLEDRNESGYALGDQFQATAWGGVGLTDWLSASVRGIYTTQGDISGKFNGQVGHRNRQGPMDFLDSYGGRYWDVGFGLSAEVPSGDFKGNRVSVEWLQPVEDDVNGFQLEREGSLFATWSLAF
jgi:hypothetical protein